VQLCADGSFTAVSLTERTQFTAHLFTVAAGFSNYSAPLENLQGGSITRDFERWMKEGSGNGESVYGSSVRETWRDSSFTGDPEGYAK
jgi:hypothetical protein